MEGRVQFTTPLFSFCKQSGPLIHGEADVLFTKHLLSDQDQGKAI